MADLMSMLNPEVLPTQQNITQQLDLAKLLRQQSLEAPASQMVSGYYVAPSITQNLARLMQGYQAGKLQQNANEQTRGLAQNQSQFLLNALRGDNQSSQPSSQPAAMPAVQSAAMQNTPAMPPATPDMTSQSSPAMPSNPAPMQDPTQTAQPMQMGGGSTFGGFGPKGMPTNQRMLAMMLDPNAYVGATMKQYEPTDLQKNDTYYGINPAQSKQIYLNDKSPDIVKLTNYARQQLEQGDTEGAIATLQQREKQNNIPLQIGRASCRERVCVPV